MGLFWAVARLLLLGGASRPARARPCSGQGPRTADVPCALSLECDFGAWDVWGNAACSTLFCLASLILYRRVFCSLAMFPGTGRRIAHLNFISYKVIPCKLRQRRVMAYGTYELRRCLLTRQDLLIDRRRLFLI